MKKFLLTLIVTMLTCIGAWADGVPERNLVGNASTEFSTANGNLTSFCIQPGNAKVAQMSVGDKICVYYKADGTGYQQFWAKDNEWKDYAGGSTYNAPSDTWSRLEMSINDASFLTSLIEKGMIFQSSATIFQRITFISESVPADVIAQDISFKSGTPTSVALNGTLDLKDYIDWNPTNTTEKTLNWESNSSKISIDNGVVTGVTATDVDEKVRITATTTDGSNKSAYVDLIVKQGYSLTLAADPTSVINNDTRTVTITPTVKVDETVQEASTYSITYSLVDNDDTKVTIDGNVVTVAKDATAGTVTVKAEVAENDTYAGTSATTTFTIENAPRIIWPELTLVGGVESMVVGSSEGTASPHIEVGNSNYVVDGNGNTVTPTSGITYEAEAIEGAEFVTILQNPTNEKWFHVTPVKVGQATIKITAKATYNGVEISDEQTAIVNVTPLKIQFTSADNLTVNDDQTLTLAAIKAAVTKVYTEANSTQTELPSSDYEVEIYKGDVLVTEDIQAPHSANFTLTIKVKSKNTEYDDADPKNVTVTVTHLKSFTLALNADKTSIMDNGQKATITPSATFNGEVVEISSYAVYSNNSDVATVVQNDDNTITVTGKNVGTVTVTVTATPTDGSTYATVTNSTTITVTESPRVVLSTQTIEGKEYVVVNVPAEGSLSIISDTKYTTTDGTTLDKLKAAENVKIIGEINNADMQKFTEILGSDGSHHYVNGVALDPDYDIVLTTLDMGGATLVEPATAGTANHSFTNAFYQSRMLSVKDFTLPTPASGASVLPAYFGNWCPNATTLTIPEGWTGQEVSDVNGTFNTSATGIQHLNLPASLSAQQYMFNPANLVTIHFAEGTTEIGENAFYSCPALTEVNFPASLETIGASAFRNCSELPLVDMKACAELTVIPENAFENCYKLETLNLPPNLTDIKQNAFYHYRALKVVIFPNKLDRIEEGAFQNEQGNNSLTDVFFTGTTKTPSYVDAWAFTPNTQMGNNSVSDNGTLSDGTPAVSNGTITRYSYNNGVDQATNQPKLTTIMHFPVGYDQYYTDPTRKYSDAGRSTYVKDDTHTLDVNNKAAFNYTPTGWTDAFVSELKTALANLNPANTFAIFNASASTGDNLLTDCNGNVITNGINGGYPDRTYGTSKIWPSQQQMTDGYAIAHAGYLWNGTEMAPWQKDIRGLYQFINAFSDAPDDPYYWEFKDYELNKWYTFCVPFNMSVDEIKNVFGDKTQVCRFSKVTRTTSTDRNPNKIVLEFRKSVMTTGGYTAGEIYPEVTASTTGILHHVPYMIKPAGTASTDAAYFNETTGHRRLPNFKRVGGQMYFDIQKDGEGYYYSFEGSLEKIDLPNHVYFLAVDPASATGEHRFFFSHNAAEGSYLSANTASVRVRKTGTGEDKGDDDWTAFFNSKTIANGDTSAPIFRSLFADDEDVTEIEIVCGADKAKDNKVYTVNGVLVNGNNLPAGLYIKNGKKFIVK